ncbi:MAG: hypothetical protein HGA26_05325, partial [Chlorobiaceae bacterium]|nr:hypothetical protein [Chlorobiaceae bacterium]
ILNNSAKHAHAHHVTLAMHQVAGMLSLKIQDDGVGFDPTSESHGNGLKNLRRRAEMLGGELTLTSEPGNGAIVTLNARPHRLTDKRKRLMPE